MATDDCKKSPAVKDMKNVIAQFEQIKKGSPGLRPVVAGSPKVTPSTGLRTSLSDLKENDANTKPLKKSTIGNQDTTHAVPNVYRSQAAGPLPGEAASSFKVTLKPVAKPSGNNINKPPTETKPSGNNINKPPTETKPSGNNIIKPFTETGKPVKSNAESTTEAPATTRNSLVSSKTKMFETSQNQSEAETANTASTNSHNIKHNSSGISNFPKSSTAPKPQIKTAPEISSKPKMNNPPVIKGKKFDIKSEDQKIDRTSEANDESSVQKDNAEEKETAKGKVFFNESESKTLTRGPPATEKPSQVMSNTLPKPTKQSTVMPKWKESKESTPETVDNAEEPKIPSRSFGKADNEQPKIPSRSFGKPDNNEQPKISSRSSEKSDNAEQPKIPSRSSEKSDNAEQPKIPSRSSEKSDNAEQPKIPSRSSEKPEQPKHSSSSKDLVEMDQPKVPLRKEQKKSEEKPVDKEVTAKQEASTNDAKEKKKQQKSGKSIFKDLQSLLRNKEKLPSKSADKAEKPKQYRLLPVPNPSGNPPRKLAKPPGIDISKYITDGRTLPASSKQPPSNQPVESYDDDNDDLYEDCDNIPVPNQVSRISEYTEEEEAKLEKMSHGKLNTTPDNYGKMFNSEPENYEDDDEIYQEID